MSTPESFIAAGLVTAIVSALFIVRLWFDTDAPLRLLDRLGWDGMPERTLVWGLLWLEGSLKLWPRVLTDLLTCRFCMSFWTSLACAVASTWMVSHHLPMDFWDAAWAVVVYTLFAQACVLGFSDGAGKTS